MIYGSVCSGVEAASVAWEPLGWRPAFFSEIEAFPRAVLAHRFPGTPLHGDFTSIGAETYEPIELLVGGTPCQSFSVAGLRGGLGDDRGNLALEYLRLADRLRPRWLVWENVPGVLSSHTAADPCDDLQAGDERETVETADFACFLAGLQELGYGFAYRVLDAQYVRVDGFRFAVPQRRQRVFVVGYLGDWRPAAAVLLERESLRGGSPPHRSAGQGDPRAAAERARGCGAEPVAGTVSAKWVKGTRGPAGDECYNLVAEVADPIPFDTTQISHAENRSRPRPGDPSPTLAKGGHPPAIAFTCKDHGQDAGVDVAPTLRAMHETDANPNGGGQIAVAFSLRGREDGAQAEVEPGGVAPALRAAEGGSTRPFVAFDVSGYGAHVSADGAAPTLQASYARLSNQIQGVTDGWRVRRLTPRECERLQGFPDDWTLIPWRRREVRPGEAPRLEAAGFAPEAANGKLWTTAAPDGPRYKAMGNSMAVNAMRWIGRRIEMVDRIARERA